ncbi:hypothetical protein Tco_0900363 [Tanacetum coccineum]
MSGSEPGEMAPEGSRAVVLPKFDMHIYTSKLTPSKLKAAVSEYCIPLDLHPRLSHPGMTMNRLPSRYIGLYIEQLEQGLRILFSSFFLAVIRHFGVHVSQLVSMGVNRRHGDTDLHDDFPTTYSESDAARLSEFLVPLRSPPRHLLYVCGLTMACRHPELQYNINDQDKNGNFMDTFLKLPTWTRTVVSKGDPILKDQSTPLHQAAPKVAKKPATVVSETSSHVEKEVVDLSVHSQSSHQGNEDEPVSNRYVPNWGLRNDLSFCTFRACQELISHLATPVEDELLGSLSNVKVISRAYQTLRQSVVAQGDLLKRHEQLNRDFVDLRNHNDAHLLELDHLRSSVRRADQDNEGLTNKLALLESVHSGYLEPKTHRLEAAEEKIRMLETEKLTLSTELTRAEADHQKLVQEFIPSVVKRLHTSAKYRQSLAASVSCALLLGGWDSAWEEKHRELFTKQYPYVQKVADSYLLPMADLLQVSPDVPTPPPVTETGVLSVEGTDDVAPKSPPPVQDNVEDKTVKAVARFLDRVNRTLGQMTEDGKGGCDLVFLIGGKVLLEQAWMKMFGGLCVLITGSSDECFSNRDDFGRGRGRGRGSVRGRDGCERVQREKKMGKMDLPCSCVYMFVMKKKILEREVGVGCDKTLDGCDRGGRSGVSSGNSFLSREGDRRKGSFLGRKGKEGKRSLWISHVEKEVVDLSVHSQSSHQGNEDEPVSNRYVPNWGLHNDLSICTFRACQELISHLATPTEDEFLGSLSNVEVISRAYQTLGQSVVAQGELLKRHEQLNRKYVDLQNLNDAYLLQLDHLRSSVQRADQDNEGLTNKLALLVSAHSGCESWEKELMDGLKDLERERDEWRATTSNQVEKIRGLEKDLEPKTHRLEAAEEKIRVLESEKLALSTELTRAEADRQKLVWEFIPAMVKRLHTSVEYRQSLAAPEEKHRELFTKQYPYVQKVADSYLLPMADLLQVSPDVPTPPPVTETGVPSIEGTDDAMPKSPPPVQENVEDVLFGTTT